MRLVLGNPPNERPSMMGAQPCELDAAVEGEIQWQVLSSGDIQAKLLFQKYKCLKLIGLRSPSCIEGKKNAPAMVLQVFLEKLHRQPTVDIELGEPQPQQVPLVVSHKPFINGYPSASVFIASDPDQSFAIYLAFHRLSTRNLLYLEAELFELQKQQDDLDIVDVRDAKTDPDILQNFRSWKMITTSSDTRQVKRVELIHRIRVVLKDYRAR